MLFAPSVFHTSSYPFARSYARTSAWADRHTSLPNDVSIESDDTSITLSMDVPGLSKEQLTIGIEGRILRIRAKDDAPRSFAVEGGDV